MRILVLLLAAVASAALSGSSSAAPDGGVCDGMVDSDCLHYHSPTDVRRCAAYVGGSSYHAYTQLYLTAVEDCLHR